MVKIKNTQIYVKNLNLKIKRKIEKQFLTSWSGNYNPRFSVIFPLI